jgi:hypothetical protein
VFRRDAKYGKFSLNWHAIEHGSFAPQQRNPAPVHRNADTRATQQPHAGVMEFRRADLIMPVKRQSGYAISLEGKDYALQ